MMFLRVIRAEMLYLAILIVSAIDVGAKRDVCLLVLVLVFIAVFINVNCERIVHKLIKLREISMILIVL